MLSRRNGADYLLSDRERVGFERVGVRPGDHVPVGELDVEVIATPGHSRHHQSFLVRRPGTGEPGALFTGGSLLDGTVGRTDLVQAQLTRQLARAQWSSVRTLATLDSRTRIYPTHGFGSFCASGAATSSDGEITLADQLHANPALDSDLSDKERFVSDLISGFGPIPAYYPRMAPHQQAGRRPPLPARRATDGATCPTRSWPGRWVIDLRDSAAYAEGHAAWFGERGVLRPSSRRTPAGWCRGTTTSCCSPTPPRCWSRPCAISPGSASTASGPTCSTHDDALTATYRRSDWDGFREALRVSEPVVVDVRQFEEWTDGHLPGALHLPVQDVDLVAPKLPRGELWVHCRSGYRAGIAASLLHRMGRAVVHVDDSWDRVSELAITTTRSRCLTVSGGGK